MNGNYQKKLFEMIETPEAPFFLKRIAPDYPSRDGTVSGAVYLLKQTSACDSDPLFLIRMSNGEDHFVYVNQRFVDSFLASLEKQVEKVSEDGKR